MSEDPIPSSDLKLGLRAPNLNRPRLMFADYFTGVLPPFPRQTDVAAGMTFPIWLNATLGCCVAATFAAIVKILSAFYGTPVEVADSTVLHWYQTQNPGADPAHPGVHDNGMDIPKFLSWLRGRVLPDGSKLIGFVEVDPSNTAEVDAAIAIFGVVWTGCTITAANRAEWDALQPFDYVPGSRVQGGHSIVMVGQGATNNGAGELRLVTWARERNATDRWLSHNVTNMYAVITDKMLGDKHFVAGMNLAAFASAFTAVTGEPFPAPVPAPVPPTPTPPTPPAPTRKTFTVTTQRTVRQVAVAVHQSPRDLLRWNEGRYGLLDGPGSSLDQAVKRGWVLFVSA